MEEDIRYSRPVATAARLGELAEDRHRFLHKRVLLTGEPMALATANGRECLLSSLRLLVRICSDISVALPTGLAELLQECRQLADRLAFGQPVAFLNQADEMAGYDAILSVGSVAYPELPWTVINSNGWLARVSSGSTNLPNDYRQANPIAALAAASLGVGEVFKRLVRLKPGRGGPLDGMSFSLFNYRTDETDLGPVVPEELFLEFGLIGVGAIGNGVVYLLNRLPTTGSAWIVDSQDFAPENLGTCILIGPSDIAKAKATFAADLLNPRIRAIGFRESLAEFTSRLGAEVPYPRVVVSCVHDIETRHAAQHLWADLSIDGAIGDFGCQVSRHPWAEDIACLVCLFRPPVGEPAERLESRATGLSLARVTQASETITEDDVQVAPAEKREWLRARIGRQICSVIQQAVTQQISEDQQRIGFEPSVPFVATLSASMVVAELVKFATNMPSNLEPRFQLDVMRGPAFGQELPQERRRDCICVTREQNINTFRKRRTHRPGLLHAGAFLQVK